MSLSDGVTSLCVLIDMSGQFYNKSEVSLIDSPAIVCWITLNPLNANY